MAHGRAGGLRMDADDIVIPERLARHGQYLEDHPECVTVGRRVLVIDPERLPLTVLSDAA